MEISNTVFGPVSFFPIGFALQHNTWLSPSEDCSDLYKLEDQFELNLEFRSRLIWMVN